MSEKPGFISAYVAIFFWKSRSVTTYRRYPQDAVRRVQFIKRARELGFSLTDIKELLALRTSPAAECGEIRARADAKIKAIITKIDSLMTMKSALSSLVAARSRQGPVTECPILESSDTKGATS